MPRRPCSRPSSSKKTVQCSFSDGQALDWIRDIKTGQLQFILFDGAKYAIAEMIQIGDQTFDPPVLDPAILNAVTLASEPLDYETTQKLFEDTCEVLTNHGIADEVARAASYFVFATWFTDTHRPAPGLVFTGPPAEANLLLQLLALVARRGVVLVEADSRSLCELVECIHPTLLIDSRNFTSRSLRMLLGSRVPRAYVGRKGSVANFASAAAIYLDQAHGKIRPDFSLSLNLPPSRGAISFVSNLEREKIIGTFQPKFLAYRLRNWDRVRQASFELPSVDAETRMVSEIFGACILDAPDIQAGVASILETHEAAVQDAQWTDLTCVTIEALFYACHQPGSGKIYVREITDQTSAILRARGTPLDLEPRAVGASLRRLGFAPKRDERGFGIRLTPAVARAIHMLAFNYSVATVQNNVGHCELCTEIF